MQLNFKLLTPSSPPSDLNQLFTLMKLYYDHDHLKFDQEKATRAIRELISIPSLGRVWFLTDASSSKIVGYMIVTFCFSLECGGREAFIDELFVLESYRSQGIGTLAIRHALAECKKLDFRAMRLEVTRTNDDAAKLYKKIGFNDLGRTLLAFWIDPNANCTLE